MTTGELLGRCEAVELGEGLLRLGGLVRLGRYSGWVPPDTGGWEPFNVYAARDGDDCLVVNSGPALLSDVVLTQLREAFPAGRVQVIITRNEFEVMGGLAAILAAYPGSRLLYPGAGGILDWIDYRQSIAGVEHDLRREVPIVNLGFAGGSFNVGEDRKFVFSRPPFGTLSFIWLYDETSGALFTSDAFSFVHLEDGETEVAAALPERVTPDYVAAHLGTRFWWLRRASRPTIKKRIEDLFASTRVSMLCPSRGAVIKGTETVRAAVDVTLAAIDLLEDETYG
jgi:flavorubredoxin